MNNTREKSIKDLSAKIAQEGNMNGRAILICAKLALNGYGKDSSND